MEREGPYILDNNIEEHSCFTCKYFERLPYWNSLACGNKLRYAKKQDNMMCLNDGSFTHLDYDEFVIPCKSELHVWKIYKEETNNG